MSLETQYLHSYYDLDERSKVVDGYKTHTVIFSSIIPEGFLPFSTEFSKANILFTHGFSLERYKNLNYNKLVHIGKSSKKESYENFDRANTHLVVHYKSTEHYLNTKLVQSKAYYLPMVIDEFPDITHMDTHTMYPQTSNIIWFGNVYHDKKQTFSRLKQKLNMDFISFNQYNGYPMISTKEIPNILSRYDIGIGVGKCAQEMLSLGLKVLVGGNQYGGYIVDQETFNFHITENCNSSISNSLGSVEKDIEYLSSLKRTSITLPSVQEYKNFILKLIF